jgi:hypothetical protein
MLLQSGLRWWLLPVLAAAAVGAALLLSNGGGASAHVTTGLPAALQADVAARLRAEHLSYRWISCVPNGRSFDGAGIVRCNVDFGEPHIVAYCSVLRNGRLLTSEDDPAIPCGHDDVGYSAQVVQYR